MYFKIENIICNVANQLEFFNQADLQFSSGFLAEAAKIKVNV
jgi:hypothetical protein